jgi:hypothetical protein
VEEDEDIDDEYDQKYQLPDNEEALDESRNVIQAKQHNTSIGSVPLDFDKSRDDPSPVSLI